MPADARLVRLVEQQLAGVVGQAAARLLVSRAVGQEPLHMDDLLRVLDEASTIRRQGLEIERTRHELEHDVRELRTANERLERLDRHKDDFIASVTHELRTPLSSIRALAELIADEPAMPTAQRRRFLSVIVDEAGRMSRLVDQVLDLARIESGHAPWHDDEVDMVALVRQAARTVQGLLHERGAVLELDLPAAVPTLRADADRLTQVMLNLLSNAIRFVPAEGGRVTVRLRQDHGGVTVEVQDNGPGVPDAQRTLVFERFRQGDATPRTQGTGLGLAISRQIVEHFGGRLWLAPDVGQGARFAFHLPCPPSPGETPHEHQAADRR